MISEVLFDNFIKTSGGSLKRKDFVRILTQMAVFCSNHIDWEDMMPSNESHPICDVIMPYTMEEEAWLEHQFVLLENAYRCQCLTPPPH